MQPKPLALKIIDIVALITLIVATYLALSAPTERVMGEVQKVFYFHIGTAWTALLGFILAAVFSVVYLITKDLRWDRLQVAAIEVSLVFFFITIVLGSIWARPAWNTWWTWDPRLTTSLILWTIYAGYFVVRGSIADPHRRARTGAVLSIVGALDVPLVVMATRWFRGIHPVSPAMEASMRVVLLLTAAAFTIFFAYLLVRRRIQLALQRQIAVLERSIIEFV